MFNDMMDTIGFVTSADPEVGQAMERELAPPAPQSGADCLGEHRLPRGDGGHGQSVLTNKYAEGYPGKRYYGGCQCVDVVEDIARRPRLPALRRGARQRPAPLRRPGQPGGVLRPARARRHGAGHEPGPRRPPDPRLPGEHVRQALYNFVPYGVDPETGRIDYDKLHGTWPWKHKPKLIVAGASAYPRDHRL